MSAVVRTVGLEKHYGRAVAVAGLDLEVPQGAVFGLLGPNGAGKSTTFGVLCGWLRPTRGSAEVLGVDCTRVHELCGRIAALPQDALLPPDVRVKTQLMHYARLEGMTKADAEAAADRALDAVGLTAAAAKKGRELSHGMAKRVGIAQCLLGRPELVLLDEPTAGLDPENARAIRDHIVALAPETTVIVSSHNLVEIQEICTHVAILAGGRLVASGSMDSLTRSSAEFVVRLDAGARPPVDKLAQRFGANNVSQIDPQMLRIRHSADEIPAAAIGSALRLLLESETPILGVERGTSLETAFLEVTRAARYSPSPDR